MNKYINFTPAFLIFFCALSMASTINTNLNTQLQIQRQQMQQGNSNTGDLNVRSGYHGGGIPVVDAYSINIAKLQLYEQWKKENNSHLTFEEWEEKIKEQK